MELSILERIRLHELVGTIPGTFATLKSLRALDSDLLVSAEEAEAIALQTIETDAGTQLVWQPCPDKEIDVPAPAHGAIQKALKALDEREALTQSHVGLWEKFFPEE